MTVLDSSVDPMELNSSIVKYTNIINAVNESENCLLYGFTSSKLFTELYVISVLEKWEKTFQNSPKCKFRNKLYGISIGL